MLFLVLSAVLAQANQSTPLSPTCFDKTTQGVVLNTSHLVHKMSVEFRELSGPREGDEQLAGGMLYPLNLLQSGLANLSSALAMREALMRAGRPFNEGMVRMGLTLLAMGLRQMPHALTAAEASTRAYQLEQVALLRKGVDELSTVISPCLESR